MRVTLIAVGRLKAGPERQLAERYGERFGQLARSLGLEGPRLVEPPESPARQAAARMAQEARAIAAEIPPASLVLLFDERGKPATSESFAGQIGAARDAGRRDLCLVIGGADGLDPGLRNQGASVLSFGGMTLPHQLVRVLVLEQLYRAATILSGHPYHRA
jgi:23S rRNA (pseudouridine1915-N3)-methyltransferase